MVLDPQTFVGQPVADLAAVIAQADSAELLPPEQGLVEPHSATATLIDPTVVHLDTLISTVTDSYLPADHPPIDLPDVTLKSFLGRGAQGWVYSGKVNSTGKTIAVKVIKGESVSSRRSALREALICAKFCHPNILRVYKVRPAKSFWVVLMELVQGPVLGPEAVAEESLASCLGQLADALVEISERGIVHRDIKPGNVLIRHQDHTPVILDFGLAVDLAGPRIADVPEIAGTPLYMTTEALDGYAPEPSWDAYSLGMTAAYILVGPINTPPDFYDLYESKRSRVLEDEIAQKLQAVPDRELREGIIGLLAAEPAARLKALEKMRGWA
jgi:hypothetical protein